MKTRTLAATVLPALAALALAAGAPAQTPDPYAVVLHAGDVMVPMRDGVRLATDVYRPARGGVLVETPLPVLLQRTPYGKEGRGLVERAGYFVRHGYVVVLQDTRGRYESEGTFSKYHDFDATDGFDTVEWIARLPYTTGDVGMFGTSYGAHTQADAAKMNPPHLKALLLNQGGISDPWLHKVRNHGAFELGQQLGWAFDQLRLSPDPVVRAAFEAERVADWFAARPLRRGLSPLAAAPEFEDYVLDQLTRADHDRPNADVRHWTRLGVNWSAYYRRTADVPHAARRRLVRPLRRQHVRELPRADAGQDLADPSSGRPLDPRRQHAVVRRRRRVPAPTRPSPTSRPGSTGSGSTATSSRMPTAVDDWPPIRLFVMGTGDGHRDAAGRLVHGGYWRDAPAWPLPEAEPTAYYFHADGTLSPREPDEAPPTTYTYDPEHPVPTIGGSFSGVLKRGAYDQREREFKSLRGGSENGFYGSRPPYLPLKTRPDVVVFQTEPLEAPVEVVGPIRVTLYASSTAVDTDFTVKLVDVYPPSEDFPTGFEMNLTDGILRARYRERPEPARVDDAGRDIRARHRALSDREPVQGRAPHPHRRLEQQLPALRRQPQHRRAPRAAPALGARRQRHPPRAGLPVPRGAAAGGRRAGVSPGGKAAAHRKPEQGRFRLIRREDADRDGFGGVEPIVLNDDGGSWLAGVAGRGHRPDLTAPHSAPRSEIASMNA